jgi:transcriptional regulator with XRE-family HTH domain
MRKVKPRSGDEAIVVTKAVLRGADRLEISQKVLASIIGLSEATISRMRRGEFAIERSAGKSFELALLFVQLFELLDQMVHGDQRAARAWLSAENSALRGHPVDLIQSVRGLVEIVGYLLTKSR